MTDAPTESSSPSVNDTIGSSTVRYNSTADSFTDTGLTNDTTYHYRIYAKDSTGNYAASGAGAQISCTPIADPSSPTGGGAAPDYILDQVTTLLTNGFRPQWSPDGEWIAYDHIESDGYFDVCRVRPDGTENECLTCGRLEVPKNGGATNYHPSGRFLAFTAEKEEHGSVSPDTGPGAGIYNDVMLLDFETGNIYRLTDVRDGQSENPPGGSLHVRFSHDGTKLAWGDFEGSGSSESRFGNWQIAVADFSTDPEPGLGDITYYNPGDTIGARTEWYEMQGWTLDDSGIYFSCAPLQGQDDNATDICHMELTNQELTRLTLTSGLIGEPAEFEEHGEL